MSFERRNNNGPSESSNMSFYPRFEMLIRKCYRYFYASEAILTQSSTVPGPTNNVKTTAVAHNAIQNFLDLQIWGSDVASS